ncbi:MAG: EAL domain-containing protein [Lachnospiraceae bacterium]|nr:EAL domain-containing protein [Lachnospiraceae bacterium]
MSGLLQKEEFFATVMKTVTSKFGEYFLHEDKGVIYDFQDGDLKVIKEFPNMKSQLYANVNKASLKILDQIFEDFLARKETGSYDLQFIGEESLNLGWVNVQYRYEDNKDSYFAIIRKIDERMQENQKLYEEVRKDPLTKLINKTHSAELIRDAIEHTGKGSIMIIDIDNFKSVNDNLGHMFGDEVIVSVAHGIKTVFRDNDIVGRIGGDEFIVYAEGLTDKEIIKKKAENVCNTVSNIYTGESDEVKISASIGIAVVPNDSDDYNELFQMADHALYYTKRRGKNGYSFFDNENEDMKKYHRAISRANEVTEEIEEVNEEMDAFYFELNDLAFRMLGETKNEDSAINLLLHRIQDKFHFSAIRVLETDEKELELKCTYELRTDTVKSCLNQSYVYTEAEWIRLANLCNGDALVYAKSEGKQFDGELFKTEENPKSGIIMSVSNNDCFAGIVVYEDCCKERSFTKKELKVLNSFERVFTVYKAQKVSKGNTNYYLKQLSERDNLTGLYKYYTFLSKMEEAVYNITEDSKILYLQVDIAHFKYINESYSYDMGDKLLKRFADLICGDSNYLMYASRIHSDNIVATFKIPASISDEEIITYIDQILVEKNAALQNLVSSDNFYINCGIYIAKGNEHNYNGGITNANYAKKIAKDNGDGKCVFFDNDMFESHKREMEMLEEFPIALKQQQFTVVYQPQIDTISKTVVGAEALSRWTRNDGTYLMPDEFVSILENANKLVELDYYVIEKVMQFLGDRKASDRKYVPVSLNLSKQHIKNQNFFEYLESQMNKYNVKAQYINFEIAEEVFISDMDDAVEFCNRLHSMGIRVMMDSFGSGYSSLNVLDKLPVDCIKIDKLFIKNTTFVEKEKVILNGIIDIAKKLRKSTATIGVETYEQNAFLCRCGCDIIQGNFYSEPLNGNDFWKYADAHCEPEVQSAYFSFDGTFEANNSEYRANPNGAFISFNDHVLPGRKVLELPGGIAGHELVELSLGNLLAKDFTVSLWFNERKTNLWTSIFYADFENAFVSLIPHGWNGVSIFRILEKATENGFYDAVGTDKDFDGWTQIAGAYNAKTHSLALFINGILIACKDEAISLNNHGRMIIGGDVYQDSFNGYVAEFRVTNKAMSAKEVLEEYNTDKQKFINN